MAEAAVRNYETVYILDPQTNDDDAHTIHNKVDSVINKFKGKLGVRDDWGTRQLAYPIKDRSTGRYCVINYSGTPGVVAEIERHFKILPNVIRYSTLLVEKDYDYGKVKKQIKLAEEEYRKAKEKAKERARRN